MPESRATVTNPGQVADIAELQKLIDERRLPPVDR